MIIEHNHKLISLNDPNPGINCYLLTPRMIHCILTDQNGKENDIYIKTDIIKKLYNFIESTEE